MRLVFAADVAVGRDRLCGTALCRQAKACSFPMSRRAFILVLSCVALFLVLAGKTDSLMVRPPKLVARRSGTGPASVFAKKLLDASGRPFPVASVADASYVLVYFSGHWCRPCRVFTPKLVEFTRRYRRNDNFEVVLVSYDESVEKMCDYMREAKMPWGGVLNGTDQLSPFGADVCAFPHLRVYDAAGAIVLDTDYSKSMDPESVLTGFKSLLSSSLLP